MTQKRHSDKYRFSKAKQVLTHIEDLLSAADSNIEDILKEIADLVTSEEQNRKDIERSKSNTKRFEKICLRTAIYMAPFMTNGAGLR
ncbi:septation ring formation regulator EzrA [Bacillus sp. SL00103]